MARDPGEAFDWLQETEWVVESIGDERVDIPRPPSVRFDGEGRFTGTTGVNRMFGSYSIDAGVLTIGGAATTLMAGPPEEMALETRFLAAFNEAGPITRSGEMLEIGSGANRLVLHGAPSD